MSLAHAQKFYEMVSRDPALLEKLRGGNGPEEFIARIVAEAKKQGLEFTKAEAEEVIRSNISSNSSDELSDQQLEAVAGGKSTPTLPEQCTSAGSVPMQMVKGIAIATMGYSWGWTP